jgi:hypothetical protein
MNIFNNNLRAISLDLLDNYMAIKLNNNKIITVPYNYSKRLYNASKVEREDYRFIANGYGIHWNSIDEDLSIEYIIKDFKQ